MNLAGNHWQEWKNLLHSSERLADSASAVPQRYVTEAESASLSELWSRFFHSCQWFPAKFMLSTCSFLLTADEQHTYIYEHGQPASSQILLRSLVVHSNDKVIGSSEFTEYFQQLLQRVEKVSLDYTVRRKELDSVTPAFLSSALQAIVKPSKMNSLKSISLRATNEFLGWLIIQLLTGLKADSTKDWKVRDRLKRLKIVSEFAGEEDLVCLPWAVEDLVQLIRHQKGLETLILRNYLVSEDRFFNYLPNFVSRACFKLLHVEASKVPCNAMESIIMAFLNSPTTHDMCLEFIACQIVDKSFQTVSSEYIRASKCFM